MDEIPVKSYDPPLKMLCDADSPPEIRNSIEVKPSKVTRLGSGL
jgi:hypothetical protein